jgi:hypothetical protein
MPTVRNNDYPVKKFNFSTLDATQQQKTGHRKVDSENELVIIDLPR